MTRYQIFHTCLLFLDCLVFQVKMLRLSYVFFIVLFIFVISSYYDSNTFVTSPSPSFLTLNSFKKPWYKQKPYYKQKHIIDRQFPSFKTLVIFKIVVISIIFIFLLFMIFLHLCISVVCHLFNRLKLTSKEQNDSNVNSIIIDTFIVITVWVSLS